MNTNVFWVVEPMNATYRPDYGSNDFSQTAVNFYDITKRNKSEDSHLRSVQ
jgi:hypothetical protein